MMIIIYVLLGDAHVALDWELKKEKAKSPDFISTIIEFITTNNNLYYVNYKQNKIIDRLFPRGILSFLPPK